MHKAVQYFNEMANLEGQGVPIDWRGVARQMGVIVASEQPAQGTQTPQTDKPAPLPEPPQ